LRQEDQVKPAEAVLFPIRPSYSMIPQDPAATLCGSSVNLLPDLSIYRYKTAITPAFPSNFPLARPLLNRKESAWLAWDRRDKQRKAGPGPGSAWL
jgi:hypothetical protein